MQVILQQIYNHLGIQCVYVGEEEATKILYEKEATQILPTKPKEDNIYKRVVSSHVEKPIISRSKEDKPISNKPIPQHTTANYNNVDIEKFELRFKNLCSTMKRTPCIWTYYSLGEDMFGTANGERRNTIKHMLSSLGMPQGTYSFVPFTAPNEEGILEIYRDEFIGILHIYKPSLVLFFGDDALESLGIEGESWQEFVVFPPI
ncbi:MAG: hypothetical protein K2M30_03290, partial [Desulfovibrionaceae bacterium]|nr:hypothetical protein [Desulfovibrionaceae bacterium]